MSFLFSPNPAPVASIAGSKDQYPVHRIYCVARNYAAHAREMGMNPDREPPFFFSKPADALVANGAAVAYPPRTSNLHHEIELVVALREGGSNIPAGQASNLIFGYAVGNDLTRRDLQFAARDAGRPWDTAKGFDQSAPLSAIHPVAQTGLIERGRIWLSVNGQIRQDADLAEMIWPVNDIIAELSTYYRLQAGDIIFTGTPAGVGAVVAGDLVEGGVDGVDTLSNRIV